jgi:hypothetical protein
VKFLCQLNKAVEDASEIRISKYSSKHQPSVRWRAYAKINFGRDRHFARAYPLANAGTLRKTEIHRIKELPFSCGFVVWFVEEGKIPRHG